MKTKFWKIFPLIISFLCFVSFITACSGESYDTETKSGESYDTETKEVGEKCFVIFEADNDEDDISVDVISGEKVTKPTDPIKAGYVFEGWFLDNETSSFDFNTTVYRNMKLKAHWTAMFEYSLTDTGCSVDRVCYMPNGTETIAIPAKVEINRSKYTVTELKARFNEENLKNITIPKTIKSIALLAFNNSVNLTNVYYDGTIEDWCNIDFGNDRSNPLYYASNLYMLDDNGDTLYNGKRYTLNKTKELFLPNSLTVIKPYTFYGWKSLESITLSSNVTEIGICAFMNCVNLKSFIMPDNIKSIGINAFRGCTSLSFNEYGNCCYLGSESNSYFALIKPINTEIEDIEINPNCKLIPTNEFYACTNLTSVYYDGTIEDWCNIGFGNDVATPMLRASNFYLLDNNGNVDHNNNKYRLLTDLVIPNTITKVGNNQFSGFNCLTSVTLTNNVTEIGDYAFSACVGLKNITIPNSVTTIGDCAFTSCTGLTNITIPDSVTNFYSYPFNHCTNLLSITIGKNVTTFYPNSIGHCYKLVEIYNLSSINIDPIRYMSAGYELNQMIVHTSLNEPSILVTDEDGYVFTHFEDKYYLIGYVGEETELTLPSSFSYNGNTINNYEIYRYCFYSQKNITSIKISEGVTRIGENAFEGCRDLVDLTIPKSRISIGKDVFNDCSSLKKIYYNGTAKDWKLIVFEDEMFTSKYRDIDINVIEDGEYSSLTDMVITNTVTTITADYLREMEDMTSVTIPNTVTSITKGGFQNCLYIKNVYYDGTIEDWLNINISNGGASPMLHASNFYILDENGDIEHKDNKYSLLTELVIPDTVISISNYQFSGFKCLTSIIIPDSVTSIGEGAFALCGAKTITLPKNITKIETEIFKACQNLEEITIPQGVTAIGDYAFYLCKSLKEITIPDGVTTIGNSAFSNCTGLVSITIPNTVKNIEQGAFNYCSSLTTITIPKGVPKVSDYLFTGCEKLANVTLPKTITSIGLSAFKDCSSLTSIILPEAIRKIGENSFANCEKLRQIYYEGTYSQYYFPNESNTNAIFYYYSKEKPTKYNISDNYLHFWHYDTDGVTPIIWEQTN